jgi:hypothetical protein
LGKGSLQLDQLRSAPWSPICASVDNEERLTAAAMLMKVDHVSVLVGQNDVGKTFTHVRTEFISIDLGNW